MRLLLLTLTVCFVALPAAAQYEVSLVVDVPPGGYDGAEPTWLTVYDGKLYFRGLMGTTGDSTALWAYDAVSDEIAQIPGTASPEYFSHNYLTVYDEKLFFGYVNVTEGPDGNTSEWQLRAYDSNTGSISVVPDINMRWGGNEPTVFDERLFLGALDLENGQELWVYSALSEQSRLVEDINPGYYHSNPKNFVDYDGKLFFSANSAPFDDRELWAFEPFTESVTRVSDIRLGTASSDPDYLTLYDDRLFFVATSSTTGRELWVYDATTDEASIVADLLPGAFSSDPKYLIVLDNVLYFVAEDEQSGDGLWSYDAASGEITLVNPLLALCGGPGSLASYDGRLFFDACIEESGWEPWFFDPTTLEVSLVADIYPGGSPHPNGSSPSGFTVYDDRLFFGAWTGSQRELWALSPAPVANEPSAAPQTVRLHAPHPNPAQDHATVTFELAEAGPVRVEVLDVLGRSVALLADGPVAAGEHSLTWEAGTLPSGLYLVRLSTGDAVQTQRLTLTR